MTLVKSSNPPPAYFACKHCTYLRKFIDDNNLGWLPDYEKYMQLDIDVINLFRSHCSSCKSIKYQDTKVSSFKGDMLIFMLWQLKLFREKANALPPGSGRTSKFTAEDIENWETLKQDGMSIKQIAAANNVSRQTVSHLINGHGKKLKKSKARGETDS